MYSLHVAQYGEGRTDRQQGELLPRRMTGQQGQAEGFSLTRLRCLVRAGGGEGNN